ncbi:MAG: hypothetical protein AAF748_09655 [Pseudomonadota bacterium]
MKIGVKHAAYVADAFARAGELAKTHAKAATLEGQNRRLNTPTKPGFSDQIQARRHPYADPDAAFGRGLMTC